MARKGEEFVASEFVLYSKSDSLPLLLFVQGEHQHSSLWVRKFDASFASEVVNWKANQCVFSISHLHRLHGSHTDMRWLDIPAWDEQYCGEPESKLLDDVVTRCDEAFALQVASVYLPRFDYQIEVGKVHETNTNRRGGGRSAGTRWKSMDQTKEMYGAFQSAVPRKDGYHTRKIAAEKWAEEEKMKHSRSWAARLQRECIAQRHKEEEAEKQRMSAMMEDEDEDNASEYDKPYEQLDDDLFEFAAIETAAAQGLDPNPPGDGSIPAEVVQHQAS